MLRSIVLVGDSIVAVGVQKVWVTVVHDSTGSVVMVMRQIIGISK